MYNSTCTTVCPTTYYISLTTAQPSCQPCSNLAINCRYCSSPTICIICNIGYVLFDQQCLNYTPTGYANVTGVAQLCSDQCVTCTNFINNCTSCRYDYYHNGNCIAVCPVSHYGLNHVCLRCASPCNTCQNQSACLSCLLLSGTYYIASSMTCSSTCPSTFSANSSTLNCEPCQPPCVTCSSFSTCITCIASTFLYNGRCITSCPANFYANTTTNTCNRCLSPCQACISSLNCLTCLTSFLYLYPNQCVPSCPNNYVVNFIYATCVNCTAPCLNCNQTYCYKC